MTLSLRRVLQDARALWLAERELLLPIAGMFFVVPMLGAVLLLASSGFPPRGTPEQVQAAFIAFYGANLLPILLINLAIAFGGFAVFNLFLQGGGRTLGEVLVLTLRRFALFFAIDLLAGLAFSIGLSLFVVPGIIAFARTWLAGPAYAAQPERGFLEAFRQGWRRSAGLDGVVLLGLAALVLLLALSAVVLVSLPLGMVALATGGGGGIVQGISYLAAALIGGAAWTALAVIRVAAYRLGEPRQGI
jgi:hypothetical protein